MRNPTVLIGLGNGREAWLAVRLDSLRFALETDGEPAAEVLSLAEVKTRLPHATGLLAEVLAEAIRANPPRS